MFAARVLTAAATGADAPGQAAHGRSDFAAGQRSAAFSSGAFQRYLAMFPQNLKVPVGVATLTVAGVGLFFAVKPRAKPLTTRTPEWEKEEKAFMSKQRAPTHQQRG